MIVLSVVLSVTIKRLIDMTMFCLFRKLSWLLSTHFDVEGAWGQTTWRGGLPHDDLHSTRAHTAVEWLCPGPAARGHVVLCSAAGCTGWVGGAAGSRTRGRCPHCGSSWVLSLTVPGCLAAAGPHPHFTSSPLGYVMHFISLPFSVSPTFPPHLS